MLNACAAPQAAAPVVVQSPPPAPERPDDARLARLQHLAAAEGLPPASVEQVAPADGASPPVPVIRLVFPEQVLFDTASDAPRPQAAGALDGIAAALRQDAPATRLTVLGHTDAIGSDAYNLALSQRRAANVLNGLTGRGVDPRELSAIAIGKRQPVASNATAEGRARNRRVEFLISSSEQANLAVVRQRPVDIAFRPPGPAEPVAVLHPRLTDAGPGLEPSQLLSLNDQPAEPLPIAAVARPRPSASPRSLAPAPRYAPNTPQTYRKQDLGPPQSF